MDDKKTEQEQELDLVPVFVWIGKGFSNFFRAIGDFFKGILHVVLLFFVFLQKKIILLSCFIAAGLALAFYLNVANRATYTTEMRVQPNFNSALQLKAQLNHLQSLVEQKNYKTLANELKTTTELASTLQGFEIEPYYNETELLIEYDRLLKDSDTLTIKDFKFEDFKNAKRDSDYEYQTITASGSNTSLLNKIMDNLVLIKETDDIKARKASQQEITAYRLAFMKGQVSIIDSLLIASKKALLLDNNGGQGINNSVFLNDKSEENIFQSLFKEKQSMLYQVDESMEDYYKYQNTVNEVSRYTKKGFIKKPHLTLWSVLIFFTLGILVAATPMFWKFLKNYKNKTVE